MRRWLYLKMLVWRQINQSEVERAESGEASARADLKTGADVFQHLVNHARGEGRLVPRELKDEDGEGADVGELEFPDLGECLVKQADDLREQQDKRE